MDGKAKVPKKRCTKLTKEQKKAVWAQTEENAGAGWQAQSEPTDPIQFENGR